MEAAALWRTEAAADGSCVVPACEGAGGFGLQGTLAADLLCGGCAAVLLLNPTFHERACLVLCGLLGQTLARPLDRTGRRPGPPLTRTPARPPAAPQRRAAATCSRRGSTPPTPRSAPGWRWVRAAPRRAAGPVYALAPRAKRRAPACCARRRCRSSLSESPGRLPAWEPHGSPGERQQSGLKTGANLPRPPRCS
jgi:hypothetical protein